MTFIITIAVIVVLIIILGAFLDNDKTFSHNIRKSEQIKKVKEDNVFNPTKQYFSRNHSSGIEVNEKTEQVRLYYFEMENDEPQIKSKTYDYGDIIESEIIIDNNSIIKTARGSQLAGAAVGSLVAGGIGAIIGGLSSDKKNVEYIKNIDLKVKVNDFEKPSYKISFLSNISELGTENKKGLHKNHADVKKAIDEIEYWHNILNLIIHRNKQSV